MSLIIFFGFATFIFLLGVLVIGVSIHQWRTEWRQNNEEKKELAKNSI